MQKVRFLWWVSMQESLTQSSARTEHRPRPSDWTSPCSCAFQGSCCGCSSPCCRWEPSRSEKGVRSHLVSGTEETEKEMFLTVFQMEAVIWLGEHQKVDLILFYYHVENTIEKVFYCFQTWISPINAKGTRSKSEQVVLFLYSGLSAGNRQWSEIK